MKNYFVLLKLYPLRVLILFVLFVIFGKPYIVSIELSIIYVIWVLIGYVFAMRQKRKHCKVIKQLDNNIINLPDIINGIYKLIFIQFVLFIIIGVVCFWEVFIGYFITILIFPFLPVLYETQRIGNLVQERMD